MQSGIGGIGAALMRAGLNPHCVEIEKELSASVNSWVVRGFTHEEIAASLKRAAEKLLSEGHLAIADSGHPTIANAQQPKAHGGGSLSSPTERDGEGLRRYADKAVKDVPTPSLPNRMDSHRYINDPDSNLDRDERGKFASTTPKPNPQREPSAAALRAMAVVHKASARVVLDLSTWRVDGRLVSDMTIDEAREIGRSQARDGIVLMMLSKHYANVDGSKRVGELFSNRQINDLARRAMENTDAIA